MTDKMKAVVLAAGFVILLGGAALTYKSLGKDNPPPIAIAENEGDVSRGEGDGDSDGDGDGDEDKNKDKMKAPDFSVLDWDGNTLRLSDFLGTPVILNFWASWCPPCKSEMPEFDAVYREVGEGIAFIMVDLTDGQRETAAMGKKFITDQGFSFPVYFDTELEAAYAYSIQSIPTTLFIDRDGYLIAGAQGAIDEAALRKGIGLIQ